MVVFNGGKLKFFELLMFVLVRAIPTFACSLFLRLFSTLRFKNSRSKPYSFVMISSQTILYISERRLW